MCLVKRQFVIWKRQWKDEVKNILISIVAALFIGFLYRDSLTSSTNERILNTTGVMYNMSSFTVLREMVKTMKVTVIYEYMRIKC